MKRWIAPAAVLLFAARLVWFVDRYAVNLVFYDQFDYLRGLREHANLWQLFSWQHGPHRMGLGYFFIAAMYRLSGWDERFEAFATIGLMVAVCIVALLVVRRIRGALSPLDACIPALVLTTAQFEIFIGTPNAAHGPIPLLLVVLSPLLFEVRSGPLRAVLGGLLAFCAAFTGFALFLVPLLVALFALDARESRWNLAGAVLCAASIPAFLAGYELRTAVSCFQFPDPHPLSYVPYAGLMIMRPLHMIHLVRLAPLLETLGLLLAAALAVLGVRGLRRRSLLDRAVFLFAGFSLIFVANTAVGRLCLGMPLALSSRYVTYVLPFWLAAYLVLSQRRIPALGFSALILGLQIFLHDNNGEIHWYSEGKARWRECFLATGDEAACNRAANFRVYPVDDAPQVREMFDFLKANRLNLYRR